MVSCVIWLEHDENRGVCAGDLMRGSIDLVTERPTRLRGLCYIIYGVAQSQFTVSKEEFVGEGKDRRSELKTVSYQGKEVFLDQETYLFGYKGASPATINIGTTRYEFAFQLPPSLPASFKGAHGTIQYKIKVVAIDVAASFEKIFKIYRVDDLNNDPTLKISSTMEEFKRFCCLLCASDPLTISVELPYTGFVPGQNIPLKIVYDNKSSTDVEMTTISVIRTTRYKSDTPEQNSKCDTTCVAKRELRGVLKGCRETYDEEIELPTSLKSSNSDLCRVIQIFYQLEVEAKVGGCSSNVKLSTPIVIGTVPLNFGANQSNVIEHVQPTMMLSSQNAMPRQTFGIPFDSNQGYGAHIIQTTIAPQSFQAQSSYNPVQPAPNFQAFHSNQINESLQSFQVTSMQSSNEASNQIYQISQNFPSAQQQLGLPAPEVPFMTYPSAPMGPSNFNF